MFDGKAKSTRQINFAGKNAKTDAKSAKELVENARKQREARAQDRQKSQAATKIQKLTRSKLARIRLFRTMRASFDGTLASMAQGYSIQQILKAIQFLVFFYDINKDVERLMSLNTVINAALSTNEVSAAAVLGFRLANDDGSGVARTVAQALGLSIETAAAQQIRVTINSSKGVPPGDVLSSLSLLNLAQSQVLEDRLLGITLALRLTKCVCSCLRNEACANIPLAATLRGILRTGLGGVSDGSLLNVPTDARARLWSLRQTAVQTVASQLLTQAPTAGSDRAAWATWITAQDWLIILQHWRGLTTTTATPTALPTPPALGAAVSISSPVISTTASTAVIATPSPSQSVELTAVIRSAELLNLLACFAETFLSTPPHLHRMFTPTGTTAGSDSSTSISSSSGSAEDAVYRELGVLFITLTTTLLGGGHNSTTVQSADSPSSAVSSVFGVTTSVGKADTQGSGSASTMGSLPVCWLVQQLLTPTSMRRVPSSPTAYKSHPSGDEMDVVGSPYGHTTSTSATASGTNSEVTGYTRQQVVSEEVYVDYLQASGWKKLEYRIAGLRSGVVAQQDRILGRYSTTSTTARGQGQQEVRQVLAGSARSLEGLVQLLCRKEVVAALTNRVGAPTTTTTTAATTTAINDAHSVTVCGGDVVGLYAQLLLAHPGDVNLSPSTSTSTSTVLTADNKVSLLISLAFANPAVPLARRLWHWVQQQYGALLDAMLSYDDATLLHTKIFADYCTPSTTSTSTTTCTTAASFASTTALYQHVLSALYLFCAVFLQQLAAVDDETLLEQQKIFTLQEIRNITIFLKRWLFKLYWSDPLFDIHSSFLTTTAADCTTERLLKLQCQLSATRLFNHLCCRNERRGFLQTDDWSWAQLSTFDLSIRDDLNGAVGEEGAFGSTLLLKNGKVKSVLTFIPQVVPFKQRVSVLHAHLDYDKTQYFSAQEHGAAHRLGLTGALRIEVRRDALVADAYDQLHNVGARLKGMVKIEFISEQGLNEAGIDGGGLFKEFIDSFAKEAFSPTYGLFVPTSHQLLTPNPASGSAGSNHLKYFNFVGKILGKSMYEHILLESEFAGGLLNFLLDRKNAIDDLFYLDEQLYRSLMQLKHHANQGGDIESLELFFETSRMEYGKIVTYELMPGGSSVRVSKSNVHAYIHQLAHHKLNVEAAEQCRALRAGFQSLIPLEWIRMFGTKELQLLISGDQRSIDVADMMAHVTYGSGYHASQPYIQAFWHLVAGMGAEDQGHLLKFVTSCSRQPLLGFSQLQPSFCIQKIPAYASQYTGLEPPQPGEVPRLPSAATCMNLLKLPMYDSIEMLRDKLLYAIRSNSGFELS